SAATADVQHADRPLGSEGESELRPCFPDAQEQPEVGDARGPAQVGRGELDGERLPSPLRFVHAGAPFDRAPGLRIDSPSHSDVLQIHGRGNDIGAAEPEPEVSSFAMFDVQGYFQEKLVDLGEVESSFRGIWMPEPEVGAEKAGITDQFLSGAEAYHNRYSDAQH